MEIKPEVYEQLGTFYLGRGYDLDSRKVNDDLILYDSKDLVTHGVVLGMTGSGKTGLCLAVLEEAAMDGIPVIAIDPKGDIANLLLTFPNLEAKEFEPWVNEDDARKKGQDVPTYAAAQAEIWSKGLADWGQGAARVKKLRDMVDVTVFTPGSSAGIPVSIVASLAAPTAEILEDSEIFNERVESCTNSLLSLAGIEGDPVQSPPHILLANIFSHYWGHGQDVTLEQLVHDVQQPPFDRVGVVGVDEFLSEKKRAEVAMKLNNLIASPSFASWLEGVPLDIQKMLYTDSGKPRISIFSIAHLSDEQRMFFVGLLLNQVLGWMRAQSGTTSLRAMLYMDEIFGYLPPSANPPSKKPMMILLKQARAFGLGILLATQNPVDLDYKALSNIGTWWLGRLQTERDKERVLDGLEGAASAQNAKFSRDNIEKLLSGLGNRVFLMNNVHEDGPVVFTVRWVMTYLRGPLSRNQIKSLMDARREEFAGVISASKPRKAAGGKRVTKAADEDSGFLPPSSAPEEEGAAGGGTVRPRLPDEAAEYFKNDEGARSYTPTLVRSATVLYSDARKKIDGRVIVTVANEIDATNAKVDWDKFLDLPRDLDLATLDKEPAEGASFGDVPADAQRAATWKGIAKDFTNWVYEHHRLHLSYSSLLTEYSKLGESEAEFQKRLIQISRERRDEAVENLRDRLKKEVDALSQKYLAASEKADSAKKRTWSRKLVALVQVAASLFSRKGSFMSASNLSRAGTILGSGTFENVEQEAERLKGEIMRREQMLADETQKIRDQYDPAALVLETVTLSPKKTNIHTSAVGILWVGK